MREITELDELKHIELEVMKKIHEFCEENSIVYYLCFGTLIGAVRHDGFIPWDDDIDIYMKRDDYEKFLKLFPQKTEELGLNYANYMTQPYYGRCFTKVFDNMTILKEPQYKTDDDIGVFVDIWPLDGTPNNMVFRRLYLSIGVLVKKIVLASSMTTSKDYSFGKNLLINLCKCFNPKKMVKTLDNISKRYTCKDSKILCCYSAVGARYKKELFDKTELHKFEDTEFYIPSEYDEILKIGYGDYMKLPPAEKRIPHHVINVFYR